MWQHSKGNTWTAGYTDGSGVVRGLGRGLAGAVGLPVSGALAAIEALTCGIAAASGVSPIAVAQRALPEPGAASPDVRPALDAACMALKSCRAFGCRCLVLVALWLPVSSGVSACAASPHLAARPSLPRLAAHAAQAHALLGQCTAAWDTLLACDPISAQAAVLGMATPDLAEVLPDMIIHCTRPSLSA
jgi:hypothetical protein